ncbi:MAG TPA: Na+/H+ antiporter NhaA [Actinoplanes sp.]|nr:Na+/H+ antiporter NhaA [Actinoplanes sp.]
MPPLHRLNADLRSDAVGGSLLIGAAIVALIWANSPFAGDYEALRAATFGPAPLHLPVEDWAADRLLAVFFFVVGNELKHDMTHGELRDPRRAALPIGIRTGDRIRYSMPVAGLRIPAAG